jgi:hypothetical protein
LDIIPVDIVVNLLISSAWYKGVNNSSKEMDVYHCTTGGLHPFRWGEMGISNIFQILAITTYLRMINSGFK